MDIIQILILLTNSWLNIFINTLINLNIIWITYPVYITWFSMEFFVEKKGIHYSHAIANSVIYSWVSIDWLRELYKHNELNDPGKLFISLLFLFLSLFALISAIRRKRIAKAIGKTGFFAYFQIMLTPFIYNVVPFSLINLLSLVIFFPFIYIIIFIIDRYIPEILEEEEETIKNEENDIDNFAEDNLQYSNNNQNYYNYQNPYNYHDYYYFRNYNYRR
ncbi:hypothetical protein YN1_6860 [Nanoarchaeota archaeon]